MKHINQPQFSNLCGQACIAMLNGISLEESIELFNSKGKTHLKQLKVHLSDFELDSKMKRIIDWTNIDNYPKLCLIKVKWNDHGSHWIIKDKKKVYDSSLKKPYEWTEYIWMIKIAGRITSYCQLIKFNP